MSDERFELLIVGGGPAGFAAADGYREAGGEGAVAIIAGEERMPYRRPPLTKELLRGEIGWWVVGQSRSTRSRARSTCRADAC
jgi:NADPH-dependent 2,4-dienoyl-CoA reductase/sulfur reductase-like enzyme